MGKGSVNQGQWTSSWYQKRAGFSYQLLFHHYHDLDKAEEIYSSYIHFTLYFNDFFSVTCPLYSFQFYFQLNTMVIREEGRICLPSSVLHSREQLGALLLINSQPNQVANKTAAVSVRGQNEPATTDSGGVSMQSCFPPWTPLTRL